MSPGRKGARHRADEYGDSSRLLLRLRMTGDRWKPDDAVREIHIVRVDDESVQAVYELGHGQFFGKDDAGMRASQVMPLLGKAKVVSVIEG